MQTIFGKRIAAIIFSVLLLGGAGCASAQAAPGKGGSTTTQSTIQLASSQATPTGTYLPGCAAASSAPTPAATTLAVTQFKQSVTLHPGTTLALQFDVHYQWNIYVYDPQHLLQAQAPQGIADATQHHCVWQYALHGAGQATVIAIGQLHCAPGKWCPRYTIAHEVDVSSQ